MLHLRSQISFAALALAYFVGVMYFGALPAKAQTAAIAPPPASAQGTPPASKSAEPPQSPAQTPTATNAPPPAGPSSSNVTNSIPTAVAPTGVSSLVIPTPIPPHTFVRQTFTIAPCAVPPVIDGKLDDACWKTATHAAAFYRLQTSAGVPDQTEAWVCADAKHLYVAFHCLDSQPKKIQGSETERNGSIFADDYAGLDIDSQDTHRNASTFIVTARGTQWELLEGGTASNITWAGDWKAVSVRTSDGWTAEFSIPFALLRYAKGTKQFGMLLYRKIARETTLTGWPYIPPEALTGDNTVEAPYMNQFNGISPPFFAPKPILLPYALVSAGSTTASREGLDIKYPLTTTLTGVGTAYPDFQDIEQSVTSITFSYTQKLLTDQRPFFAEGAGFLPNNTLFYSRQIGDIDGGLKVAGKTGATTLGVLGTTYSGDAGQDTLVFNMARDIGLRNSIGVSAVEDQMHGFESNQVGSIYGGLGSSIGSTVYRLSGYHDQSFVGGSKQDGDDDLTYTITPTQGRVNYQVSYDDIGPNFVSNLGYVPNVDEKGFGGSLNMFNQFDKGYLENYYWELDESSYQHHTGGFFQNANALFTQVRYRPGWGVDGFYQVSAREQYHDRLAYGRLHWNTKTLYQQGSFEQDYGHLEGEPYTFTSINQGFLISRPFSLQLSYNRVDLGGQTTLQNIVTGTYRLSSDRTLGARVVSQGGQTDIFFSYGQQVRSGNDIFIIFGDPNSPTTKGKITLKIVSPLTF